MASIQRKVAFYYLSQERTGDDRKKHAVDLPSIEANFQYIYDKMNVLSNGHHAEKILYNNVNFVAQYRLCVLLLGLYIAEKEQRLW